MSDLTLDGNRVGASGCSALATALLSEGCALSRLSLFECEIDGAACALLAAGLQVETSSLRVLILSGNQIGDVGGLALAQALDTNRGSLAELRVRSNGLSDEAKTVVCNALAVSLACAMPPPTAQPASAVKATGGKNSKLAGASKAASGPWANLRGFIPPAPRKLSAKVIMEIAYWVGHEAALPVGGKEWLVVDTQLDGEVISKARSLVPPSPVRRHSHG